MKRIVAFIKPNMLEDVVFALHKVEDFAGASISEVKGIGCGMKGHVVEHSREAFHNFKKAVRMEIVCVNEQVDEVITAIEEHAHTGLPDDGKIYVSDVEQAVRIRTGERGEKAVWVCEPAE